LRAGAADDDIADMLGRVWAQREDRYSEVRSESTAGLPKVEMSYIGG
jgi:cyclic pyranopterin phosphate synthase